MRHPYSRLLSLFRHEVLAPAAPGHGDLRRGTSSTTSRRALLESVPALTRWTTRRFRALDEARCPPGVAVNGVDARGATCDPTEIASTAICCLNLKGDDGHLAPQSLFVFGTGGERVVDHVLRYETLGDDYARLYDAYSTGGRPHRPNGGAACMRRRPDSVVTDAQAKMLAQAQRSTFHVAAARLAPRDVPPALRRQIDTVYAADFDLLGYGRF